MFADATEDDGSEVGHPGHHVTTQRLRGHVSTGNATHSSFLIPGFTSDTVIVSQCLSFLPLLMLSTYRIRCGYYTTVKLVTTAHRRLGVLNFLPIFSVK